MFRRILFILITFFLILNIVLLLVYRNSQLTKKNNTETPISKKSSTDQKNSILLENKSKYYTIELINYGENLKSFLLQNKFFNNDHLYLYEKGQYFSAKGRNIRIILVDDLQNQTQLMFGDITKEHFIGSSVGAVITLNEIVLYLHLDSRLKQKLSKEKITAIANSQIAQRIYMMIDHKTVQEAMNKLVINKNQMNFFNVK